MPGKVVTRALCSVSELPASSWDAYSKISVLRQDIRGRCWSSDVKNSFVGHLLRPSFRVSGPNKS